MQSIVQGSMALCHRSTAITKGKDKLQPTIDRSAAKKGPSIGLNRDTMVILRVRFLNS
jgi:hypothetical protein